MNEVQAWLLAFNILVLGAVMVLGGSIKAVINLKNKQFDTFNPFFLPKTLRPY